MTSAVSEATENSTQGIYCGDILFVLLKYYQQISFQLSKLVFSSELWHLIFLPRDTDASGLFADSLPFSCSEPR